MILQLNSSRMSRNQTCIKFTRCDRGSTNPALFSSNEYSISPSMVLAAGGGAADMIANCIGAGVMAICIGIDTVEGVEGTGTSDVA